MMPRRPRNSAPSNAVTKGATVGGALGTLIDVGAVIAGHPLPPGTGAALGAALTTLFAYFSRGGRQGEAE
jgi:hypothetical protein